MGRTIGRAEAPRGASSALCGGVPQRRNMSLMLLEPSVPSGIAGDSAEPVTEAMIRVDIAAGAPANRDGTLNLVHYAACLAEEMGRGD